MQNPARLESFLVYGNEINQLLKNAFKFSETGKFVWFISPEPFTKLPTGLTPPYKEALKLVTFLYLKDSTDLLKHLNSIHIWYRIPELIIINDFQSYTSLDSEEYNPVDGAFICASFVDAGNVCVKKLNKFVYVVASVDLDKCRNKDNIQILLDLYFNNVSNCNELSL